MLLGLFMKHVYREFSVGLEPDRKEKCPTETIKLTGKVSFVSVPCCLMDEIM